MEIIYIFWQKIPFQVMIKTFWTENNQYVIVLAIIVGSVITSNIVRKFLNKYFNDASNILRLDQTRYKFFINIISVCIYTAAAMFIMFYIPELKAVAFTLFAGAGIFAAIVGFASQQAFSNVISGIFIVLFKPFNVNDWIEIGSYGLGQVEDITLRHTILRDFENKRIIIPNSVINSEVIVNESIGDAKVCEFIEMKVALNTDIEKAMEIMRAEAINHPSTVDNRTLEEISQGVPEVRVRMVEIGEYFLKLRAYVWAKETTDGFVLKYELMQIFRQRFIEENIEIPVPHRKIIQA